MRTKPRSGPDPLSHSHGCAQLDRHIAGCRQYRSARGSATGYMRKREAAVAHLSQWLKASDQRLAGVDEGLAAELADHHLPGCRCAANACHPNTGRASLGHLLVVPRDVIEQGRRGLIPARLLPLAYNAGRLHPCLGRRFGASGNLTTDNWQLASLPKSLVPAEIEQLEATLGHSSRR